ncbi:MAG TPA: HIRAN domain-containing protein [Balneolaceae bacterium]|nr:HIRAN domain-containing protein [Balneolaceae bacterium]
MNRNIFLKALFHLPFGGFLAKWYQSDSDGPAYLLNKFYVAGFQYYKGPSIIDSIGQGEWLQLKADPANEYDRFAVKILWDGEFMLGHVPHTDNRHISRLLQQNVSLYCTATEVNPKKETWEMLKVEVWL